MAEAVFAAAVADAPDGVALVGRVDSAGTAGYHVGESPDPRTIDACRAHGIPISHAAQQVTRTYFHEFDYLLAMDEENMANLERIRPPNAKARVQLFGTYDQVKGDRIIRDPYYGGREGFDRNFKQVTRCSQGFLQHLRGGSSEAP